MAERLLPELFSEFTRCGACDRSVPRHVPDPPSVSLYEGLQAAPQRLAALWQLCPPCLWEFESVVDGLDRLAPVRGYYDNERDTRPTACGRCSVPIDYDAFLLDVRGKDGCEDWYTGLCGECAEEIHERIGTIPTGDPPGREGIVWPPALTVPDEQLVDAAGVDGAEIEATRHSLVDGDWLHLSAYQPAPTGTSMGQYLDVCCRVVDIRRSESTEAVSDTVLADPLEVYHEYVEGRTDVYEKGYSESSYRIDAGTDVDLSALPPGVDPGTPPVVRPRDGDPLVVTVLERVDGVGPH